MVARIELDVRQVLRQIAIVAGNESYLSEGTEPPTEPFNQPASVEPYRITVKTPDSSSD